MLMSWKRPTAAALVAAALVGGSSARAGDLFQLALPAREAPAKTLALQEDADTLTVGGRGYYGRGFAYYRYPVRSYYYPRFGIGYGYGYAASAYYYGAPAYYYYNPPVYYYSPPVYYYSAPPCYYSMGLGAETSALAGGNVTYSVTRPNTPGAEQVQPPLPRDGTYRYDGGPDNPVPMPKADPGSTSAPRHFHIAPLDKIRVSLPHDTKEPAKGKFVYPAYGEEPRRTGK
jgi:hypothetical protein